MPDYITETVNRDTSEEEATVYRLCAAIAPMALGGHDGAALLLGFLLASEMPDKALDATLGPWVHLVLDSAPDDRARFLYHWHRFVWPAIDPSVARPGLAMPRTEADEAIKTGRTGF